MKVLIAEDSRSNQMLISAYIQDAGHEVVTADDGQQAIDVFNASKPDLVIMDVEMPVKSGFEAATEIRQKTDRDNDWVPIIFLSGMSNSQDIVKGIDAGGDDYLVKPIDAIVLNAKLKAMARIAEMRHRLYKANLELKLMSAKDGLTGLANRRHFDQTLNREMKRAARTEQPLSLLMCDIDHFKSYNDNYGHQGGDDCLKQVAHAMQQAINRPFDLLARYGGEEFAVILPETDMTGAKDIAHSLLQVMNDIAVPHAFSNVADHVTLSLGVASLVNLARESDFDTFGRTLIEQADKSLYQAKLEGRNRVVCSQD